MLPILLGAFSFGLTLYLYLTWNFSYWKRRGVTGPKPHAYLGTFPKTALLDKNSNYISETSEIFRKYYRKHRFIGVFEYREPKLMILDPALVADIYVKYFKHFADNSMSETVKAKEDPLFKSNPFIATGAEWKERRAELAPAFTMLRVKAMYPIIENSCQQLVDFINNRLQSRQPIIASKNISSRVVATSLFSNMYGLDAKAFDEHSDFLDHSLQMFHSSPFIVIHNIILSVFPILRYIFPNRSISEEFNQWFQALYEQVVKYRETNNITRDDYLNFLLELQRKKKSPPLLNVVRAFTFFLDGFETTSYILGCAINELAKSKECQEKLRAEVKLFKYIGFEDLNQMPYLDAFVNETTRVTPFPFPIWKTCTENIELTDFDGRVVEIEKGTKIILPTTALHNHPDYFGEPEKFDPERFNGSDARNLKDAGVFMPFGNGPRICMGMRWAVTQIKAVLCALVDNFELSIQSTPNKPSSQAGMLFFSDNSVHLEFKSLS